MNQQTNVLLKGVDCDNQVLNRPWRNVRYTGSLRLPEIIFKTTRGQIEPGKACSQEGGMSGCIQRKIKHLTLDSLSLLTNIYFFQFSLMNFLYPTRITDFFTFLPPQSPIIQTPSRSMLYVLKCSDLLPLFVLTDAEYLSVGLLSSSSECMSPFPQNTSIHLILAVRYF